MLLGPVRSPHRPFRSPQIRPSGLSGSSDSPPVPSGPLRLPQVLSGPQWLCPKQNRPLLGPFGFPDSVQFVSRFQKLTLGDRGLHWLGLNPRFILLRQTKPPQDPKPQTIGLSRPSATKKCPPPASRAARKVNQTRILMGACCFRTRSPQNGFSCLLGPV